MSTMMYRRFRTTVVPLLHHGLLLPRRATAGGRALPDFVVLGAMKAGTTSLYHAISQHPQVHGAVRKGVHYFDVNAARGLGWYRAHFPLRRRLEREADRQQRRIITGEASPSYLVHPRAPAAIHATLPGARLLVVVRDPVKRAYSHYNHNLRKTAEQGRMREPLPFPDALAAEEGRLAGEVERMLADPTYNSLPFTLYSYQTRGRYIEQLERYAELFPRDQILVVPSEALYRDVQRTMDRVFDFLGLDPWIVPDAGPKNAYEYRAAPLDDATRDLLAAGFAPYNRRLYEWVGETYGWTGD